jgi:hypothetical protein
MIAVKEYWYPIMSAVKSVDYGTKLTDVYQAFPNFPVVGIEPLCSIEDIVNSIGHSLQKLSQLRRSYSILVPMKDRDGVVSVDDRTVIRQRPLHPSFELSCALFGSTSIEQTCYRGKPVSCFQTRSMRIPTEQ